MNHLGLMPILRSLFHLIFMIRENWAFPDSVIVRLFDRYHHKVVTAGPIRYECVSKDITEAFSNTNGI